MMIDFLLAELRELCLNVSGLRFTGGNMEYTKKGYVKKTLKYLSDYKKEVVFYLIGMLITMGFSTITPFFDAKFLAAITKIIPNEIIKCALIVFALNIISHIFYIVNSYTSQKIKQGVSLKMKKTFTEEMFALEVKNFDKEGTGFFSQRINSDSNAVIWFLSSLQYTLTNVVSSFGVMIYMFLISPIIAIFILFASGFLFLFDRKSDKLWEENRKVMDGLDERYSSSFSEIIRGIRDIKVLNLKKQMLKKTAYEQELKNNTYMQHNKKSDTLSTLRSAARELTHLLVILLGLYLIKAGSLTGPTLLVIFMYRYRALGLVDDIARIFKEVKECNYAINRLYEVLDGKKYPKEKYGNVEIKKVHGAIEFRNVDFAYDEKLVLKDVSFKIEPNETVGFVGRSGQGKTTIFNLLSKLYSVNNGSILIDDVDINDLTEDTIRNNISVITQNPYIFNMSIKDNLKIVKPKLSNKEMLEKAKLCALDEVVKLLAQGYDSHVGENGVTLSGGQRQRLAIARALIKESEIILLDEATSSLDNETQAFIHNSIKKISSDYTILIIAHRLSTVKNCDKIIVIDDGRVVGIGKHQELMKNNKIYQKLYNSEIVDE